MNRTLPLLLLLLATAAWPADVTVVGAPTTDAATSSVVIEQPATRPLRNLPHVTLNVEEEEITSVLRLLAESQHMNILAGPDVSGTITINLYDVPFYDALDAILGVAGFTHYQVGNII